ncbi:MAG: adenylate cyclase [Gammaproteobacteria bacterium]|jgi:adenylate cyclase
MLANDERALSSEPKPTDTLSMNSLSPVARVRQWFRRMHHALAGTEQHQQLPSAVRESIARQQDNSEVLIGWVQLIIVIIFSALYMLSPAQTGRSEDFMPVPFALAAYFAFTTIRLILAHRRTLPNWFLYLSVVFDIGLLMGLIWSFHLQYGQPASFYLKVPTVLYLFIFIALRALRFEASYVVFAGLCSALGWLALVWYATNIDPDNPMITKDYVEYMTSNSVLLGAEFDKVISILIVTLVLALSLTRAQRLLVRATVESTRARELSRFVPHEVATDVVHAGTSLQAQDTQTRDASILFIDLADFTSLSEQLEPHEVIETLNDYFASMASPLERHAGVITQFQGDAILASFNVPRVDENHARSAIETAIEMQSLLSTKTFGPRALTLHARIGINTGPVVGGLIGTRDRVSYTVHGDAVNLAARLENLNKEYGTTILVSEQTRQAAGADSFAFESRGNVKVRGKQQTVSVYEIAAIDQAQTRMPLSVA